MTWQDRLKESIILTSPDGNVFEPQWIGNARTIDKKLGIFDYPKLAGTVVQDLDIGGTRYPLTLYFEGANNDIEAGRFLAACAERGTWQIDHPVRGLLSLQLSTVTEQIRPVDSGNLTVIETEWIETIDATDRAQSTPQIAAAINHQAELVHDAGATQLQENVKQARQVDKLAVETTALSVSDLAATHLGPLYTGVPELNAQINSIVNGVQNTVDQSTIDVLSLAGHIQNLVTLPVLATQDIRERLTAYGNMIAAVIGLAPTGTDPDHRNVVAVQELTLTACIVAMAEICISGNLDTRGQSIETAQTISDGFIDVTDALDLIQEAFIDKTIDLQYFSQSSSFSGASVITGLAIEYLLIAAFDLSIERRFELDRTRAPIEITITEYGTLGPNDQNFDLFIASNGLKGQDILILPASREVVVYV